MVKAVWAREITHYISRRKAERLANKGKTEWIEDGVLHNLRVKDKDKTDRKIAKLREKIRLLEREKRLRGEKVQHKSAVV